MSRNIVRITGRLEIRQNYCCATCGAFAVGDPVRLAVDSYSIEELGAAIASLRTKAAYMPAGWAAHGTIYQCPRCPHV